MKSNQKQESHLGNDRSIWLAVASILSTCALVSSAGAANITDNGATAPSGNILASQLTDVGPGAFDGGRNYADNGGPPGQTFIVNQGAVMGSVTVLGRGDSAGSWNNGPQPFTGSEVWGIQVGSVNPDGSIFVLDSETATGFAAPANLTSYLTFNLANPVALSSGATYVFSIHISGTAWYGLAHSDVNAYAGGTAINNNSSLANPGGNAGGLKNTFNGFAAPINPGYDYVFAINAVPEPTTLSLLGLGGLGLMGLRRRRA